MSPGVLRILERAIQFARGGQRNPFMALVETAEVDEGDGPMDHCHAFLVLSDAAGGNLFRWFEGQRRKKAETVALLEEALFQAQLR